MRLAAIVLAGAMAGAVPGLAAGSAPSQPTTTSTTPGQPPSTTQVQAAVRAAEHSRALWATVNICNTRRHPHTIGIRGQMPALGFKSRMTMEFQVDYWSGHQRGLVRDPAVRPKTVAVGSFVQGLHQSGYTFHFSPPVVLSGQITFRWRMNGRVIGKVTKRTAHGIKGVKYSDPHGHSTATCRILS